MAGPLTARIANVKRPRALDGAPYLKDRNLPDNETVTVFLGNARAAIEAFPKNVNVAVALVLAIVGGDEIAVVVISDPDRQLNMHRITLEWAFGRVSLEIESAPTPDNPRSRAIAAYSVLAKLENLDSSISFC